MGKVQAGLRLFPHPAYPPVAASGLVVRVGQEAGLWHFDYELAEAGQLVLPPDAPPSRTDGLWRHSCFELFVRGAGNSYLEFNFSPSSEWAAYAFDDRREGMRDLELTRAPLVSGRRTRSSYVLRASLAAADLPAASWRGGLAAVVEERGGKSFWALAHPGQSPDFHHPEGFQLSID